jgi:hypothetical protein
LAKLNLTSGALQTTSPIASLYTFLCDFNNFKHLLPADKIENFTCTTEACSFDIRGITHLSIVISDKQQDKYIQFTTQGLAKFNFNLNVQFSGEPQLPGKVEVLMDATLNPFIKTFAEKPLSTLVNTIAEKIATQRV